ncbi:hypothetical protein J6590_041935 [Homalodisca vitripennis]|nr:hypothetical protein J6590_041935 [Homalodisca vitripennis]
MWVPLYSTRINIVKEPGSTHLPRVRVNSSRVRSVKSTENKYKIGSGPDHLSQGSRDLEGKIHTHTDKYVLSLHLPSNDGETMGSPAKNDPIYFKTLPLGFLLRRVKRRDRTVLFLIRLGALCPRELYVASTSLVLRDASRDFLKV